MKYKVLILKLNELVHRNFPSPSRFYLFSFIMLPGINFISESENMSAVNIFGLWNLPDGTKEIPKNNKKLIGIDSFESLQEIENLRSYSS